MNIFLNDITSRFGILNSENLQMFVRWVQLSPGQEYPQKSEEMNASSGFQLDVGQFAYVTLKSGAGKHIFSVYILVNSETTFIKTTYYRISLTHFMLFGKNCKDKVADFWEAYKKADKTVSMEESLPRHQRLENLVKRCKGSYNRFLGLAKAHDLINGRDQKQVDEIKRFWDDWCGNQHLQQQAPQVAAPAQSPFAVQQQPAPIASGPLQSPFMAQQPIQQAPVTPPMALQIQALLAALQSFCNQLQQLLTANTAQSVTPRVK